MSCCGGFSGCWGGTGVPHLLQKFASVLKSVPQPHANCCSGCPYSCRRATPRHQMPHTCVHALAPPGVQNVKCGANLPLLLERHRSAAVIAESCGAECSAAPARKPLTGQDSSVAQFARHIPLLIHHGTSLILWCDPLPTGGECYFFTTSFAVLKLDDFVP